MKIKLDENLGELGKEILVAAGHQVSTVIQQQLSGATDDALLAACCEAGQILVTLDRDFGEVMRFPPEDTPGIVVIDCRQRLSPKSVAARITDLSKHLAAHSVAGHLWIVEPGRLRIHESRNDNPSS